MRSFRFYGAASSIVLGQRLQSSVDPCELSVFEEQPDFHVRLIVDAGAITDWWDHADFSIGKVISYMSSILEGALYKYSSQWIS